MSSFSSVARGTDTDDPQQMVEKERAYQRWVPVGEVALRFQRFLEICGVEKAQFERELAYSSQKVGQWFAKEKPAVPGGDVMRDIHRFAADHGVQGVTYDWFNYGIGNEPRRAEDVPNGEHGRVLTLDPTPPALDAAKFHRLWFMEGYSKEPSRFIDLDLFLLRGHAEWRGATVRGFVNPSDNMRGEIEKGDLAFVETADNTVSDDGGMYALKLGGIPQIRYVQLRGKGILRLQGTKSYMDSIELSGAELDDLEIGGRVIGRIGKKGF